MTLKCSSCSLGSLGRSPIVARVPSGEANTCLTHEIEGGGPSLDTSLRFCVVRCARQISNHLRICDSSNRLCGALALQKLI